MAMFLLAHEFFFVLEDFDQAIWFNRTEDRDELWAVTERLRRLRCQVPTHILVRCYSNTLSNTYMR